MKKIFGIIFLSFFLTESVFSAPQDGKGELKLSNNVANQFINYIRGGVGFGAKSSNNKPMTFYVTLDGSGSYFWYCPYGSCQSGNPKEEMKLCEQAYGMECKRFARKKQVRWKNGINPVKGSASKFHEKMTDSEMLAKLTELGFYGNTSSSNSTTTDTSSKKKTNENDVVEKIKELNDLYKSGALTKEEFTKLKKELLN